MTSLSRSCAQSSLLPLLSLCIAVAVLSCCLTFFSLRLADSHSPLCAEMPGCDTAHHLTARRIVARSILGSADSTCEASTLVVIMPHFLNLEVSVYSLRALIQRQSRLHCVRYFVISEETQAVERIRVRHTINLLLAQMVVEGAFGDENVPCSCSSLPPSHNFFPPQFSEETLFRNSLQSASLNSILEFESRRVGVSRSTTTLSMNLSSMSLAPFSRGSVWLEILEFPMSEVGGSSLQRLHQVVNTIGATTGAEYMVMIDTDVIVLAQAWDDILLEKLNRKGDERYPHISTLNSSSQQSDRPVVLASINPRRGPFAGQSEWNFLGFRYSFWHHLLNAFFNLQDQSFYHDVGHWWTDKTVQAGMTQYLWQNAFNLLSYRSPMIVGDDKDPMFALHFFYSSRRHKDKVPQAELQWICTEEEYHAILQLAMTPNLTLELVHSFSKPRETRRALYLLRQEDAGA